jgi:hypothetical protein
MYTPKILEARPLDDYKIWLKFTDQSAGNVDLPISRAKVFLHPGTHTRTLIVFPLRMAGGWLGRMKLILTLIRST